MSQGFVSRYRPDIWLFILAHVAVFGASINVARLFPSFAALPDIYTSINGIAISGSILGGFLVFCFAGTICTSLSCYIIGRSAEGIIWAVARTWNWTYLIIAVLDLAVLVASATQLPSLTNKREWPTQVRSCYYGLFHIPVPVRECDQQYENWNSMREPAIRGLVGLIVASSFASVSDVAVFYFNRRLRGSTQGDDQSTETESTHQSDAEGVVIENIVIDEKEKEDIPVSKVEDLGAAEKEDISVSTVEDLSALEMEDVCVSEVVDKKTSVIRKLAGTA